MICSTAFKQVQSSYSERSDLWFEAENQFLDKRSLPCEYWINVFLPIKPVFVKRDMGVSNWSRDSQWFNSFPIIRLYNPKIRRVRYNSPKVLKRHIFYFLCPCVHIGEYCMCLQHAFLCSWYDHTERLVYCTVAKSSNSRTDSNNRDTINSVDISNSRDTTALTWMPSKQQCQQRDSKCKNAATAEALP